MASINATAGDEWRAGPFAVPGYVFEVRSDQQHLADALDELWSSMATPTAPVATWSVTSRGPGMWSVDFAGQDRAKAVSGERLLDRLHGELNRLVATHGCATGYVLVHAGVVEIDGQPVLLSGTSAAGKTTLVARLLQCGARYLSDEFAVLDPKGRRLLAYPKPLTIKRGARQVAAELGWPPPASSHGELGGGRWYVPAPGDVVRHVAGWPSMMILLAPEGPPHPQAMHPADALLELVEHSPCRLETSSRFGELAELARDVRAYRLGRTEPRSMARAVDDMVRTATPAPEGA